MRIALEQIGIASPCDMRWDELAPTGTGEAVRHCGRCRLNVYDLSGMSEDEVRRTVVGADGRLCARIRRRADGTVSSRDCPVGLRLVRERAIRLAGRVAAAMLVLFSTVVLIGGRAVGARGSRLSSVEPFAAVDRWLNWAPVNPQYDEVGSIDLQAVLESAQDGG